MRRTFKLLLILAFGVTAIQAQDSAVEREVESFRAAVATAINAKDARRLNEYFAEGFTHTHAIGKVDDKKRRLEVLLAGDETIDTVEPDSTSIKTFGKDLAVVQGRTTFRGDEIIVYQWTYVYRRSKGKWQTILSQAAIVTE